MTAFKTTRRTLLTLIGGLAIFRPAKSGLIDTFSLEPQLALGQVMRYRQDLQNVRNGEVAYRSRSTVTLEVRERTPDGWLARWTPSGTELLEADPRMRPLLEVMQGLWEGVPIDLLLDEGGRLCGLADLAAVKAHGATSLERLLAWVLAQASSAPMAGALRAAIQPTLADGAVLAQSLMKEPAILLGAMGHDYRVGEPLEVRSHIGSPLGAGEIPVLGRYKVRGISSDKRRADIGWLMVIDRPTTARLVGGEVLAIARRIDATRPASVGEQKQAQASLNASMVNDALASLDFDDLGDFIVDTTTSWPVSVKHVRRVSTAGGSRVDTVEFTRLE